MKPRASSLNPLIYPSWWGEDAKDFEKAILRKDRSNFEGRRPLPNIVKVLAQTKAQSDSLERRMQEARKNMI